MGITWLKLDHHVITDVKLRRFSIQEKWAWITLLCLASQNEDDRGMVPNDIDDIADLCDYEPQDFKYLLDKFKTKGMIDLSAEGIKILNWEKRQHTKPSDTPEATRERKRKQRAKKKDSDSEVSRDVTPTSRDVTLQIRSDQDLDPDPEQIQKKEKDLSSQDAPEPANRERGENFFDLTEEEFFKFIDRKLPQDGAIKNRVAYVRSVMKTDRETWIGIYLDEQQKRDRNDSLRAEATNKPDFAVNPLAGVDKSSASATEIDLRRENFRRIWNASPSRRKSLEEALRGQPELMLFVMDGQLCDFGSEVAA